MTLNEKDLADGTANEFVLVATPAERPASLSASSPLELSGFEPLMNENR